MFDNLRVGSPMKSKIGSDVLVSLTTQRRTRPAQHKCKLCPSDFTTKYNLKSNVSLPYHRCFGSRPHADHMNSHYAIRDYRCEGCQQTFGVRHVFKRHQRTCKRCVWSCTWTRNIQQSSIIPYYFYVAVPFWHNRVSGTYFLLNKGDPKSDLWNDPDVADLKICFRPAFRHLTPCPLSRIYQTQNANITWMEIFPLTILTLKSQLQPISSK